MNLFNKLTGRSAGPALTSRRIALAVALAVLADVLQLALVPFSWVFTQQIIDLMAMGMTIGLLGFHFLLLPTLVIEFIPVVGALPTWTGCVLAVIALRKRAERHANSLPPIITVEPTGDRPAELPPPKRLGQPDAS